MSRHHRALSSAAWAALRRKVFIRDGWRCTKCGKRGRLECHHVKPLAAGGSNRLANLVTLCRHCHLAAHPKAQRETTPQEARWAALRDALRA